MAHLKRLSRRDVRKRFPVRIQDNAEQWYLDTKPMRDIIIKMLEHYTGGWFAGDAGVWRGGAGFSAQQPLNLIDRGVQIIGPYLAGGPPKVMVDAKRGLASNRPFARTLELALEHLFREIKFHANTLRPAIFNSMFSLGITKTGVMKAKEVEIYGHRHDVGQPYCDNIYFDDYRADPLARNREENEMEGHQYVLEEEFVKTSGLYRNHDHLKPDNEAYNDSTRPQKVSKNRTHGQGRYEQLRKRVRLQDFWIPDENIIITIPLRGQGNRIMRTVEWDGPEGGPFDVLGYRYFPESILCIPPVFTWLGYNNIINTLVAKMNDQAKRERKVLAYDLGSSQDAKYISQTPDGSTVGVKNIDGVKDFEIGGVSETNFQFVQYMEQQYSIAGGNLYTVGGRETGAETLGQEQMLQANASKALEDMVQQVHQFTKSIIEKLAWFMWSDPLINLPVIKRVAGYEIETEFSQETKEGDFYDFGFDIEPYSMSRMNPEIRYQRLMQLISQVVLPLVPISATQGSQLNVDELVKEAARFLDVRNMDRWWSPAIPQEDQMNPYQPMQGTKKPKSGQADGRFSAGDGTASNMSNLSEQQSRAGGQSSAQFGKQSKGV